MGSLLTGRLFTGTLLIFSQLTVFFWACLADATMGLHQSGAYSSTVLETIQSPAYQESFHIPVFHTSTLDTLHSLSHPVDESNPGALIYRAIQTDHKLQMLAHSIDQSPSLLWVMFTKIRALFSGISEQQRHITPVEADADILPTNLNLFYTCYPQPSLTITRNSLFLNDQTRPSTLWQSIYSDMLALKYDRLQLVPDHQQQILTMNMYHENEDVPESVIWQLNNSQSIKSEVESIVCAEISGGKASRHPVFNLLAPTTIYEISRVLADRVNSAATVSHMMIEPVEHRILHLSDAAMAIGQNLWWELSTKNQLSGQKAYLYRTEAEADREMPPQPASSEQSVAVPGIQAYPVNPVSGSSLAVASSGDDSQTRSSHTQNNQPSSYNQPRSSRDDGDDDPIQPHNVCPLCNEKLLPHVPHQCDIEHDGRLVSSRHTASSLNGIYIPPGNPALESYRISTFIKFPPDAPVNPIELAQYGFFYTGHDDQVRCFSCEQDVANWALGDDVGSREWHKPNCQFALGENAGNIPLSNTSPSLNQRSSAQAIASTSSGSTQQTPSSFSSPIEAMNEIMNIEVNHNGHTLVQINELSGSTWGPSRYGHQSGNPGSHSTHSALLILYPCRYPCNPHMELREARLQTFLDFASIWPAHRIDATPAQIADAGMYYLGDTDRVRCWYCNGGLKNWNRHDDPWEEHAKWYPSCEYVLQQKGPAYVSNIVSQHPNLERLELYTSTPPARRNSLVSGSAYEHLHPANSVDDENNSFAPEIVDYRNQLETYKPLIDDGMNSEMAAQLTMMGFEHTQIREALQSEYLKNNQGFENLSDWTDAILDLPQSTQESLSSPEAGTSSAGQEPSSLSPTEQLRQFEDRKNCINCHKREGCYVLVPCGHLGVCEECQPNLQRCPTCNTFITEKIRAYSS